MSIYYDDIANNYELLVEYLIKSSDSFSVITNLKKPYSKIPPNCEHDSVLELLKPYLVDQIVNVKEWPGTETKQNHKVLNMYRCCKQVRMIFTELPNFFLPFQHGLPEDICFYRDSHSWFTTISHERLVFISGASKEDLAFFSKSGIRYRI